MTVSQAAKILEVSEGLVRGLLKAGKIRHARIGLGRGVIRIDRESLEVFKLGCQVEASAAPLSSRRVVRRIEVPDMLGEIRRRKALRRRA